MTRISCCSDCWGWEGQQVPWRDEGGAGGEEATGGGKAIPSSGNTCTQHHLVKYCTYTYSKVGKSMSVGCRASNTRWGCFLQIFHIFHAFPRYQHDIDTSTAHLPTSKRLADMLTLQYVDYTVLRLTGVPRAGLSVRRGLVTQDKLYSVTRIHIAFTSSGRVD